MYLKDSLRETLMVMSEAAGRGLRMKEATNRPTRRRCPECPSRRVGLAAGEGEILGIGTAAKHREIMSCCGGGGERKEGRKGLFTYDVRKNLRFFYPSPLSLSHSGNLSVLSSAFEPTPFSAGVIFEEPQRKSRN